jgi:hypothetical protein
LEQTAKKEKDEGREGSVRVLFTGSIVAEVNAPKGGIEFQDINNEKGVMGQVVLYGQSKVGNLYLGKEFARKNAEKGEGVLFMVGILRLWLEF